MGKQEVGLEKSESEKMSNGGPAIKSDQESSFPTC